MASHHRWATTPEQLESDRRWARATLDGATLGDLRHLVGKTQAEIAELVGTSQVEVSRVEKQPDLQLSTIRRYLEALGGELVIVARFDEWIVPLRIGQVHTERDETEGSGDGLPPASGRKSRAPRSAARRAAKR